LREIARSLDATLVLEPGRHLAYPVGKLVTRVLHVKHARQRSSSATAAATTCSARSARRRASDAVLADDERERTAVDVVGPLCESSDFLALGRNLPLPERGDLIAVELAGAYGRVMSSTYNARPLCAEVVLEQGSWRVSRERETYEDLVRNELG
jgi:diaminopimelate decarboxylase